jgi:protein tyrosine phosphatase (PTP) superfamily phosphohydrolase (DUF442 family)
MKMYRTYMFRSKDPVIDQLRTALQDKVGGQFDYGDLKQIEDDGGPTVGCMASWFFGKTKRPQNSSIEAAGRSIGLMRVWVPLKLEDGPTPAISKARKRKKAKT